MSVKVLLKRATAKKPAVGDLEYGELAVDYSKASPTLFFKETDGTPANDSIVELKPTGAVSLAQLTDTAIPSPIGPSVGQYLRLDTDKKWKPAAISTYSNAVKPAPQKGTVTTPGLYHSGYIPSLDSITNAP